MNTVQIKRINPLSQGLQRQHDDDAGWDVSTIEGYSIGPGEHHGFLTGFSAAFPHDFVAVIKDRSSLGSKGIHVLAGVIDAGYRGEWKIILLNTSQEIYNVQIGDRIAQCLFLPVPKTTVTVVEELPESERGTGGFGSTGK